MKVFLIISAAALLVFGMSGCGNSSNPVNSGGNHNNTATSTWNATGNYWNSVVNASDYTTFAYFSFGANDTVTTGMPKPTADIWDIGFRREVIKLNGGSSTANGGDVEGVDLGAVDYAGVTIGDTLGAAWTPDFIDYFIHDWYNYDTTTHQLTANRNVYSMKDASGNHYVKFQIDSLVGAAMPPDMGTVYLTYYYQDTAGSLSLAGTVSHASITVGSTTGYFDFSSGTQVTPADPSNSLDWDIAFNNYNLMQNSGPNGTGGCEAFLAYTELGNDPTNIDAFTAQPGGAPLFTDIPGSALTEWYNYNGTTHQLTSKAHVYLIRTGGKVYKLRIESYYANVGGVPTSGHYTFIWNEL